MADGIEARARQLKQLKRDLGVPLVKPRPIWVELLSHTLDPLGPLLDKGPCPPGAICYNVAVIPTGLHFPPEGGTHWHPTGETYVAEIDGEAMCLPCSRQVPNLITTEAGAANVTPKPSRVDAPIATGGVAQKVDEPVVPSVTAEEIAAARAEAKAMRLDHKRDWEVEAFGNSRFVRKAERVNMSWLWGGSGTRVVRSQVMPEWPAKD